MRVSAGFFILEEAIGQAPVRKDDMSTLRGMMLAALVGATLAGCSKNDQPGAGAPAASGQTQTAPPQTATPAAAVPGQSFRSLDASRNSRVQTPREAVVRDAAAWAALWAEHAGPEGALPSVDFGTEMVIAIFAGSKPNGCYTSTIEAIRAGDGKLTVQRVDTVPGPDAVCTMMMTSAAHLVALERSDAAVEYSIETRTLK